MAIRAPDGANNDNNNYSNIKPILDRVIRCKGVPSLILTRFISQAILKLQEDGEMHKLKVFDEKLEKV